MIARILLDPTAENGGGAAPTTPVVAAPVVATPAPAEPKADVVTRAKADHDAEQAELAAFRTSKSEAAKAEASAKEKALADKGKWEELIALRDKAVADEKAATEAERRKYAELETSTQGFVTDLQLTTAIAARTDLAEGAATKLAKLLAGDLEAKASGKTWKVATRDGKSASDHLAAYLALPENALFLKASGRPGAGANGGNTPAPQGSADAPKPGSLDAIAAEYKARQGQYGEMGLHPISRN